MELFPLYNSLRISFFASVVTLITATGLALWVTGVRKSLQGVLDSFFTLSMVLPPTVIGFLLLMVIAPKGIAGEFLQDYFNLTLTMTWQASILAVIVVTFPIMYRTARGAFDGINRQQVQVAQTLGLGNKAIFWRIILPQCKGGLLAGFALAFARGLGEYGATSMVSGYIPNHTATISTTVAYYWQTGQDEQAIFWVVLNLLIACVMMALIHRISGSKHSNVKVI